MFHPVKRINGSVDHNGNENESRLKGKMKRKIISKIIVKTNIKFSFMLNRKMVTRKVLFITLYIYMYSSKISHNDNRIWCNVTTSINFGNMFLDLFLLSKMNTYGTQTAEKAHD
jgi:hypothetical protein